MRPMDDDRVSLLDSLMWQRAYVEDAGSPTAAEILRAVIDDVTAGGSLASRLPSTVRFGDLPGLRVMAAVHRAAIDREAPEVALRLPTLGGVGPRTTVERADFRRAVVACLTGHDDLLQWMLAKTPQTNETGRAAALRVALASLGTHLPVRLREFGASAGLNLRVDRLPGDAVLEAGPLPAILDRIGCDLEPVDPTTPAGRALLSSYIWVDDVDRFARLSAALSVAREVPAEVRRMDAIDFCGQLHPRAGSTLVLWHSAMWVYLPPVVRAGILERIAVAGEAASAQAPFVHASWEWDVSADPGLSFALVVRRWDGIEHGQARVLLRGMSHGAGLVRIPESPLLDVDPLLTA